MEEVYPAHTAVRRQPVNIVAGDLDLFAKEFSRKIEATTVQEIVNAEILEDTVFNRSQNKFYIAFTHAQGLSFWERLKRLKLLFKPVIEFEEALWVTDNWTYGYFHWIADALSRLIAAEKYQKDLPVLLPKKYMEKRFVMESLARMNVRPIFFEPGSHLKIKRLILPSYTAEIGNYNREIILKVRQHLLIKGQAFQPSKRVYISRQNANKRKITNEDDLVALLKKYNYEIRFFENSTLEEQIRIMMEASHLIGLHGSGLTNMLYMSPHGKVLELRNEKDSHNNCYFSMASDLSLDYYYLINKGESTDTTNTNVTVDLAAFKNIVEMMD